MGPCQRLENTWRYPGSHGVSFCSPASCQPAVADINPGTNLRPLCPPLSAPRGASLCSTHCHDLCCNVFNVPYSIATTLWSYICVCSIFPHSICLVCIQVWFIVWQTRGPHALICPRAPLQPPQTHTHPIPTPPSPASPRNEN